MAEPSEPKTAQKKLRGLYHDLGLRVVKLLDDLLIMLPFACCWFLYYGERVAERKVTC